MLTGIRVITLLELAFWLIRFICRRCFGPHKTNPSNATSHPGTKKIEEIEKRLAYLEKGNSHGSRSLWKGIEST